MDARQAIKLSYNMANMVCMLYLEDLSDADLLVRPVPGANHTAWQLGHLVVSEHSMLEAQFPGSMPALPAGFAERYAKDTSGLDSPEAFDNKATLLATFEQQRAKTVQLLDGQSDADLDRPAPEKFQAYIANVGDLFSIQGSHWLMHCGQWAITRRKLGRPVKI